MLLQYSILDEFGDESGYHKIYSIDLITGKIKDCFENVPNKNRLNVFSFYGTDSTLYFSAEYGTSIVNYSVDLVTNQCEQLSLQRKMEKIFAF